MIYKQIHEVFKRFIRFLLLDKWIALVLLISLSMPSQGKLFAQLINLNMKNAAIEKVLASIKKQSDMDFIGDMNLIKTAKPITIQVKNVSLETVLHSINAGQDFELSVYEKTILIKNKQVENQKQNSTTGQETYQLRGKIASEDGKPLIGATIILISGGGNSRISSNNLGEFSLQVRANSELVISMLGYESQNIQVLNRKAISIVLKEQTSVIQETVVTGFGTKKRESFTGASTTITKEQLDQFNNRNIFSIIENLDPAFKIKENLVDGSNPNVIPDITVRGQNMVSGAEIGTRGKYALNSPLIIMDGMQVGMEYLYDFDINRIETITLLKDASATSLYGSRGANGVLVIETRLPKQGKLSVSYGLRPSTTVVDLSDYNLMNASQKLEYEKLIGTYDSESPYTNTALHNVYGDRYADVLSGVNTDWLYQPVQTTTSLNHSLRVEGGKDEVRYSIDGSYGDTKGAIKESGRRRAGAGFNLMYRLANKFSFRNVANFSSSLANNSPYENLQTYANLNPYFKPRDENGELIKSFNVEYVDVLGKNSIVGNPLYDANLPYKNNAVSTVLNNNLNLEYYINPHLRVNATGIISKTYTNNEFYRSPNHTEYVNTADIKQRGVYNYSSGDGLTLTGSVNINYGQSFGKHIVSILGNSEVISRNSKNSGYSVTGFMDDDLFSPSLAMQYTLNSRPTYANLVNRMFGMLVNGNYSYDGKYVAEGSYRLDGSSTFGKDKRFSGFWSAGLAYNLHKENFLKNGPFNLLRFFGNYGVSGADSFAPTMTSTAYSPSSSNLYYNYIGYAYSSEGNSKLKWPLIYSTSLGLEATLFKDLLNLRLNAYKKTTKDMVSEITVAPSLGLANNQYFENLGEVENKGFEIYTNIRVYADRTSGFSAYINASGAHNTNVLTKISEALQTLNTQNNNTYGNGGYVPQTSYYQEGESLDNIKGVPSLGIDPATGKEIFVKLDGSQTFTWDANDIRVLANSDPKLNGNIGATINYKGLSVQGVFYYIINKNVYNSTLVGKIENVNPLYNVDERVLTERWQEIGDLSLFKSINDRTLTQLTSRFLQNENTFRMSAININYTLNQSWLAKYKLQRAQLNFSMNDVFRLSTVRMERGTSYPFARTYNLGLSILY